MTRQTSGSWETDLYRYRHEDILEVVLVDGRHVNYVPDNVFEQLRIGSEVWVATTFNRWPTATTRCYDYPLSTLFCFTDEEVEEEILRQIQYATDRKNIMVMTSSSELADQCRALGARVYGRNDGAMARAGHIYLAGTEIHPGDAAGEFKIVIGEKDTGSRIYMGAGGKQVSNPEALRKELEELQAKRKQAFADEDDDTILEVKPAIKRIEEQLSKMADGAFDFSRMYVAEIVRNDSNIDITLDPAPSGATYSPIVLLHIEGGTVAGPLGHGVERSPYAFSMSAGDLCVLTTGDFTVYYADADDEAKDGVKISRYQHFAKENVNRLLRTDSFTTRDEMGVVVGIEHDYVPMYDKSDRDDDGVRGHRHGRGGRSAGEEVPYRPLAGLNGGNNGNGSSVIKKSVGRGHDATPEDKATPADPPEKGRGRRREKTAAGK